jgi:hypothetical protein
MRNDDKKNKRGGFRTNAGRKPTGNKTLAIRIDERLKNLVIDLKNALAIGDLTNADIEIIRTTLKKHDTPTNNSEKIRLELELPKLYGYSIKNKDKTTELIKQARHALGIFQITDTGRPTTLTSDQKQIVLKGVDARNGANTPLRNFE